MNLMVVIGVLMGLACYYLGVPEVQHDMTVIWHVPALILVLGGTISSTIISTSFRDFKSIINILTGTMYFRRKELTTLKAVEVLIRISETAHKSGKGSVLEMGKGLGDGFMDRALALMGSGLDPEFVRLLLETDILEEQKRHIKMANYIKSMGSMAPMWGMMGTVTGVLLLLRDVKNIESVVSGLSLALIATLYGVSSASLLFTPISVKLKALNEDDLLVKEVIKEGVLAIMANQIPLKVEKMMMSYLSTKAKLALTEKKS